MPKSPNILFITSDQQRPDLVGCFGRVPVQTPNLDRLCADGTAFMRAYVTCPLCTPSRASMLTGQYPSRHGAWSIGTNTPSNALSLPEQLTQGAGYRTAIIGKSHLQSNGRPENLEALPQSQDWEFFKHWNGPWYGFEHARINVGHGDEPHAYCMHYGLFLHENGVPPVPPYFADPTKRHTYKHVGRWALPEKYHTSTWVADETISYLNDHQREHAEKPFYMFVNFPDPHGPFIVPEPWDQMYAATPLQPPLRLPDEKARNGTTLYAATVEQRTEKLGWHQHVNLPCQESFGIQPDTARTEYEEQRWRIYMGMQSLVDKNVGRILDTLAANGQDRDTLIVYTSDHGDYMGDHWLWFKGGSHYDAGVRVPCIMRWPGHIPAGVRSDALVSLVDLPATFMSAAGLKPHPLMQGVDQLNTFHRPDAPSRTGLLVEQRVEQGLTVNSWITDRYRLSVHSIHAENRDEFELYDFKTDPNEMENLALRPESQGLIAQLMGEMIRHRESISGPWFERTTFA
jgi:arylsulfatase A-like enzyme